jgi:hypothetical protein
MKIEVLEEAKEDLISGYHFYEKQSPGLGSYFLDSLYSEIDSLLLYAGIHRVILDRTAAFPIGFHLQSITVSRTIPFAFAPSLIADAIRLWPGNDCRPPKSLSTGKWHEDCLIMLLPMGKLVLWQA